MARTKEFDPDAALAAATQLFTARGYEGTSVDDLVTGLGVARGSLYATFGNKHALYLRALDRYQREQAAGLVEALRGPGPLRPKLRRLFDAMVADSLDGPDRAGCFLVNATTERAGCDAAVARRVADNAAHLEATLRAAVEGAQAAGEVPAVKNARALARFLSMTLQGIRVAAKATPDRAVLADMVAVTLAALD